MGGHPKILSILIKNFIRNKMDYGSTIYANAPKTTLQKLKTIQNTGMRLIGGFAKTTLIHVMAAINATPGHRKICMAKKEVSKSIFNTNPLGRDCNTGLPVTGNAGKLAKIAIKIYRFTEGKIPVFSVKN
jgi:hypothetical protein